VLYNIRKKLTNFKNTASYQLITRFQYVAQPLLHPYHAAPVRSNYNTFTQQRVAMRKWQAPFYAATRLTCSYPAISLSHFRRSSVVMNSNLFQQATAASLNASVKQ
jgi:hypothetical protein